MTKREKTLLAATVTVIVLWGGWTLWGKYSAAIALREGQSRQAQRDLRTARSEVVLATRAKKNLEAWREQSLPVNIEVAQTEYRAWLMDCLNEAGLEFNQVRRTAVKPYGDAYTAIAFAAHAEGDLEKVTRFLYRFYKLPQLHKLTQLSLRPAEGDGIGMDIMVEALVVDGTERSSGMAEGESDRLALEDVDAYLESIKGRNLFKRYTPPPPPRRDPPPVVKRDPPPKPQFDHAKHAYVSAALGDGQGKQVWINVRTTGKTFYLSEGDPIEVGDYKGTVKSIGVRTVVVEVDGKLVQYEIGDQLREGKTVEASASLL